MAKIQRIEQTKGMDRKALLNALKITQAAVDKGGITGVEQAQDFVIRRKRVIAYNDTIAISAPLEKDTKLDLTVRAEDLYKVLQSIDDDVIEMDLDEEGDHLCISSKGTDAWLAVDGLGEVLEDLIQGMGIGGLKEKQWQPLPEDFIAGLELCSFAASSNRENQAFHALFLDGRDVWATDDYRISNYKYSKDIEFEFERVLIPLGSIKELCKHTPREVQRTDSWVHFRDGNGLLLSTRTLDVDFPDCSAFIKVQGEPITLPVALADALEAVLVFSPGEELPNQEAEVEFTKGMLVCSAQNQRGKIERRVPLQSHSANKELEALPKMRINPTFFIEVLSHTATLTIHEGRALFSTKKFKHVMNLTMV